MKPPSFFFRVALALTTAAASEITPTFSPTALPSLAHSGVPSKVNPDDGKRLLKDYQKFLDLELQSLKRQNQLELKELDASFRARYKEWIVKEREARHKYFNEHPGLKREEKMSYIADYKSREKIFLQFQKEQRLQRQKAQEVRLSSVKADQAIRLKEFKDDISRGDRPPENLWTFE